MKKYEVGDIVMVPVKITEVHPQGLPGGMDEFGRPKNPTEREAPDTVIGEFIGVVALDAAKRIHFSADSDF